MFALLKQSLPHGRYPQESEFWSSCWKNTCRFSELNVDSNLWFTFLAPSVWRYLPVNMECKTEQNKIRPREHTAFQMTLWAFKLLLQLLWWQRHFSSTCGPKTLTSSSFSGELGLRLIFSTSPYVTLMAQLCRLKKLHRGFFFSWCTTVWLKPQSSACRLLDKHLEVLKLLMAAAGRRSSQSQPHFRDPLSQSGGCPEHMGGPVGHERDRVGQGEKESRENKSF